MGSTLLDTRIALSHWSLRVGDLIDWASTPTYGAVGVFVGVVRDDAVVGGGDNRVAVIDFEAFDKGFHRQCSDIVAAARTRWPDLGRIALVHRVGSVLAGEPCVAVVVSAPHRETACAAQKFCIDVLKQSVPVWKTMRTGSGQCLDEPGMVMREVGTAAADWNPRLAARVGAGYEDL